MLNTINIMTQDKPAQYSKVILAFVLLWLAATGAQAQTFRFNVSGALKDSVTLEAIPYVNIIVTTQNDTTFVKGTISDDKGAFIAKGIEAGEYFLKVSCIGYQNRYIPISLKDNVKIGNILMKPGAELLEAVQVTASRPIFSMSGEKMIYSVQDDPSVKNGTTGDALQNTPGVEVDIQGNVKLRGISSVDIWINDHPSHLTTESLKAYLKSVPASSIKRIETITNPSAKYATDKQAIINIITDAEIELSQLLSVGFNGTTTPMAIPWVSYMVGTKKSMLNVWANTYNMPHREDSYSSIKQSPWDDTAQAYVPTQWDTTQSHTDAGNKGYNIGFTYDVNIDSTRSLNSYGFMGHWGVPSGRDVSKQMRYYPPFVTPALTFTDSINNNNNGNYVNAGLFYVHKLDTAGQQIRLEGSVNAYQSTILGYTGRIFLSPHEDYSFGRDRDVRNSGTELDMKARYTKPLNSTTLLSAALSLERSNDFTKTKSLWMDSNTHFQYMQDTLRSNATSYNLVSAGGDVNLEKKWGNLTMELGLGAYNNRSNFVAVSQMPFRADTSASFVSMKPSIHFSYNTPSFHSYHLNYTLNMEQPAANKLTHFREYDLESYTTGNPKLKRGFTHHIEAGWSKYITKFGTVGIDAYSYINQNAIGDFTDVVNTKDPYLRRIIYYSYAANMSDYSMTGATLNAMFSPSGTMSLRMYANIFNYQYTMKRSGGQPDLSDNMWSYSLRANLWWKFRDTWQFFANAEYSSPTISLGSKESERYELGFGISADLFKKRMSVWAAVQDVFNWGARRGYKNTSTNDTYYGTSTNLDLTSRYFLAGFAWRFGKLELADNIHEQGGMVGGGRR